MTDGSSGANTAAQSTTPVLGAPVLGAPDSTAPSCSVVICAYTLDRWDDLSAAVDAVLAQSSPASELLVVIDHNDRLLARAREQFLPRGETVTVVANAHPRGLSGARNTSLDIATGDVVVFLDDDATPRSSEWLASILGHYSDPSVYAVGGSAHPVWPTSRPPFLPTAVAGQPGELDWIVGCTYRGQPTTTSAVRNLMGANMSFRREPVVALGGFVSGIGRIGRIPLGCEETELCIRLRQTHPEAEIVFDPSIVVDHTVSADRTRPRYLLSRSYAEGVSKAAIARLIGSEDALSSERAYTAKILPRAVGREASAAARGNPVRAWGAMAVVASVGAAGFGYVRGRLSRIAAS
ncbi:glycosyltransferase family 2 protein [Rhodococcus sp. NPDC057297]|uniref:glycosyltransferase family 2 protein n=1 Tax=Rhodococcus sp. NPDC057297 TaxID=3346090 RepID=UPI00363B443F